MEVFMASCDICGNYEYDEVCDEYICQVNMDEDDFMRLMCGNYKECPYYQNGDEYAIVRKQI